MKTSVPQYIVCVLMGRIFPQHERGCQHYNMVSDNTFLYEIYANQISIFQEIVQFTPKVYKEKNAGLTFPSK
jgi:hypothetical protein